LPPREAAVVATAMLVPLAGQAVAAVTVTHRDMRVALEQREKATQVGRVALARTTPSILLAVAAARAAQVVTAAPIMAALVAATGRTITPTAPPAVRVLERGLAVAVARFPALVLLLVQVVALALVTGRKAAAAAAELLTRAAAAVVVAPPAAHTETVVLAVAVES